MLFAVSYYLATTVTLSLGGYSDIKNVLIIYYFVCHSKTVWCERKEEKNWDVILTSDSQPG